MADGLEVDFLVMGGGMAGMTAAGYAAEHGATVVVVEKAREIGGSAVLSSGTVWTAASVDVALEVNPSGDPVLTRTLVENFDDAMKWLAATGVEMTERRSLDGVIGFPAAGQTIDILGFLQKMRAAVVAADGWIGTEAEIEQLIIEDGAVVGGMVRDRDGVTEVRARWTLLASGGFQAGDELRATYVGPHARDMIVRSNKNSAGRGLTLALSAGAALSPHMDSFYGHTMAYPLARQIEPRDYVRLSQMYTPRTVLIDEHGDRFVDESLGYDSNGRAVARRPNHRAVMIGDAEVRAIDRAGYGLGEQLDRPAEALAEGAHVAEAETLGELDAIVATWGYQGAARAVADFNAAVVADPDGMKPGRKRHRRPLDRPPYFAMELQPAITFTMGGVMIDADARALRPDGHPVPGLLAAGADAGGLYHDAYLGGLCMGLVFGRQAARVVLEQQSP